jgi:hypothetical protein
MADNRVDLDPSTWDPALDAVVAAPKHHKVIFENERLRVLEVTLEPNDEEPIHHHRGPSVSRRRFSRERDLFSRPPDRLKQGLAPLAPSPISRPALTV